MLRTRSCVLLFLLFVLPLVLCDQGFPQAGVPPGYQLLTDPQMSGGLLITQRKGSPLRPRSYGTDSPR